MERKEITVDDASIRQTAIHVVIERIAELELLQSSGLAPADYEIERRIQACQSLQRK
jgi:hypothetical protein